MSQIHYIVTNLIKIMADRNLTKSAFAEEIGFIETKWNKISNGKQALSVIDLSKIAEKLQMRDIDIITYPKEFTDKDCTQGQSERVSVTFEVSPDKRDYLLKMVMGDQNQKSKMRS
ncbi:MAG: helix-turn-helix transcriptional regulator [Bacteroidales bacterium]|jgi:DNA-binding Xre family transcriptional regulator|nr:helix-turn-helix transcriptional regulator [Bacteroidales bacterium]